MQILFLKNKHSGFTLLELSISLLIVSLLIGFSMPRLSALFQSPLEKEALQLAKILSELKNEAVLERASYKVMFDLHDHIYTILKQNSEGNYSPHSRYEDPVQLKPPILLKSFSENTSDLNESKFGFEKITFGKIFEQNFTIQIEASGFMTPLGKIMLSTPDQLIFVEIKSVLGKIEVSPVYNIEM